MRIATICVTLTLLVLPLVAAPQITHDGLSCIPTKQNVLISATVAGGADQVRVYFRDVDGCGDYYIDMRRGTGDSYSAVLPLPERPTKEVVYRIEARDGEEQTISPEYTTKVLSSCESPSVERVDPRARGLAIGQTKEKQPGEPCGFLCDGIVVLINVKGEMKANGACRRVWVPWIIPILAGAGAATIIIEEDNCNCPVSPCRP